jgi:DNA-binding transcriptional ArsR family regulator
LERAATVKELAVAVKRPKSTVAHHVTVLVDAGLLRVVRTRRVKAIDERWYGRTGRRIDINPDSAEIGSATNLLAEAASDAGPAAERDALRATVRHVRVPDQVIGEFWERALAIADELTRQPRGGDRVHAFVVASYPTGQPTLPDPIMEDDDDRCG